MRIRVEGARDKGQVVTVGRKTGKEETTQSWFEELAMERCDRIMEKKQKRNPPKGVPL